MVSKTEPSEGNFEVVFDHNPDGERSVVIFRMKGRIAVEFKVPRARADELSMFLDSEDIDQDMKVAIMIEWMEENGQRDQQGSGYEH